MSVEVELDHTSLATRDAGRWLEWVTHELGATPVMGESMPDFRYVLCRVDRADPGNGLELMEPRSTGPRDFLSRFVDRHGQAPHHLTFTVPDLQLAVRGARELGMSPVGVDVQNPGWQEAFLLPDAVHGVVIQLGQTDVPAPDLSVLRGGLPGGREMPFHHLGADRSWWSGHVRASLRTATLVSTALGSTDLEASERLFGGLLGAKTVRHASGGLEFRWRRGRLDVELAAKPGVRHLVIDGGPSSTFAIADTRCVAARA
ncbi:VOC family protein [Marmoricola sp. RAF53]|uniref:VOC family protein n=1 Tax=Marmoricola sp. RAF53 TaxID=3233059 RepID=UPI003F954A92